MYRLQGIDANFLYQDTPTSPMHTLKIYIMNMDHSGGMDWKTIVLRTQTLLNVMPILRERPVFVPFGLHHPVMIVDPDFELESHIYRCALPLPAGKVELEAMIAQISGQPLEHHRPLWELWVIEGLQDGRTAFVLKIHHALADGMASVAYIRRAFSANLDALEHEGVQPPTEAIPSKGKLVFDALVDHVKYDIRNLPKFVGTLAQGIRRMRDYLKSHVSPTMQGVSGNLPRCPWNYALTSQRSFSMSQISLDDVNRFRHQFGGSVNDVVLALCATSLRHYLTAKAQLPQLPLVSSIPVSTDDKNSMRDHGNRVANISTLLHLNIDNPIDRFSAIQESTQAGKAELEMMGKDTWSQLLHYSPPSILTGIYERRYRLRKANRPDYLPPSNLIIANVPGPREMLTSHGSVLSDLFSMGPLVEGIGLNITVWSYANKLNFSFMACKKYLPDISLLADGIVAGMEELLGCLSAKPEMPVP